MFILGRDVGLVFSSCHLTLAMPQLPRTNQDTGEACQPTAMSRGTLTARCGILMHYHCCLPNFESNFFPKLCQLCHAYIVEDGLLEIVKSILHHVAFLSCNSRFGCVILRTWIVEGACVEVL